MRNTIFQPSDNNQQAILDFNNVLAKVLKVSVNSSTTTDEDLIELKRQATNLSSDPFLNRNKRLEARELINKLVSNRLPIEALNLICLNEIGAIESVKNEKDDTTKADALMRVVERSKPIWDTMPFNLLEDNLKILMTDMLIRLKNGFISLEGKTVYNPGKMSIEEYMQTNFADIEKRLSQNLPPRSTSPEKKI